MSIWTTFAAAAFAAAAETAAAKMKDVQRLRDTGLL
jgi:hypothetical protein